MMYLVSDKFQYQVLFDLAGIGVSLSIYWASWGTTACILSCIITRVGWTPTSKISQEKIHKCPLVSGTRYQSVSFMVSSLLVQRPRTVLDTVSRSSTSLDQALHFLAFFHSPTIFENCINLHNSRRRLILRLLVCQFHLQLYCSKASLPSCSELSGVATERSPIIFDSGCPFHSNFVQSSLRDRIWQHWDSPCNIARLGHCNTVPITFSKRAALSQQLTDCLSGILFDEVVKRPKLLDRHLLKTGETVGPLYGVPILARAKFQVKGYDTFFGIAPIAYKPAIIDSILVFTLLPAGTILYLRTYSRGFLWRSICTHCSLLVTVGHWYRLWRQFSYPSDLS